MVMDMHTPLVDNWNSSGVSKLGPLDSYRYSWHVRFLFAVIANRNERFLADASEMAAIDQFNEKIEVAGQRILAVGFENPSSSVVFDNRDGAGMMYRGPVVDSDEFMAGLWIIEAPSESAAHQLAADASRACNRRIEVRAIL
jgi:hypothetical protein